MKKILFPTDFSPAADHAFVYALNMADAIQASLLVVHLYELPQLKRSLPNTIKEVYESIEKEAYDSFQKNLPHLDAIATNHRLNHIPVSYTLKAGETLDAINHLASAENVDFIVMGTKGASGLKEILIGSVAAEVMENAPCPVIAIPEAAVFDGKLDRIAFATDFKEQDVPALKKVLSFARDFSAKVFCVYVDVSHTESYLKRMEQMQLAIGEEPQLECRILEGSHVEQALSVFLEEESIDLLTMVIRKRNFIQELFNYSQTKQMVYHTKVPILALQSRNF